MTSRRAHATAGAAVAADDEHLLQSVVKVFTVHSSPNYFQPWQNKPQRETSGSGVVVTAPVPGGVGILTNAHVACSKHNTVLRVQNRQLALAWDTWHSRLWERSRFTEVMSREIGRAHV